MLKTSLLCTFAAVALAQTDTPVSLGPSIPAAGYEIMAGAGTLKSGVTIRFRTVLVPAPKPPDSFGEGGIWLDATTFHRYMVDRLSGSYFGYDLVIGPGDAADRYLATFQPLTDRDGRLGRTLKPSALPKYPPQLLRDGDIIELDLMVSPDGRQRLTDYIEILSHPPEPAAAATTAEPRDFTVDDGPVTFNASHLAIWIDGRKVQGIATGFTGKPGATFWIAFPGQGRYVLSLAPHDGFLKSGAIRDNVISFQDGGRQYEVRFMTPIAGGGKAWNLYMLHDLTYQPDPNRRNLISTGTDRLENLLPKR